MISYFIIKVVVPKHNISKPWRTPLNKYFDIEPTIFKGKLQIQTQQEDHKKLMDEKQREIIVVVI